MEAKEKAIQLVKDYHNIVLDVMPIEYRATRLGVNRTIKISAKQCALIAVEEIIGTIENIHKPEYVAFDIYEPRKFHLEGSESEDNLSGYEINEYWQKVKTEIEKL